MSTPPEDRPTVTIQQRTAEPPAATTGTAAGRSRVWQRGLPARIGPARRSTVIMGALFILLYALYLTLPQTQYTTVTTTTGETVRVRTSQLSNPPAPTDTPPPATDRSPVPTSAAPSTQPSDTTAPTAPTAPTTSAPRSTTTRTTSPGSTTSRATPTTTTPAPTTAPGSAAPTS